MITKFRYFINEKGLVARAPEYSFTAIEDLAERLAGIDNSTVVENIANTTLKGEAERDLIGAETEWFKAQTQVQDMDAERKTLEAKLMSGDRNGNPLTPETQGAIKGRIAELKEGSITVEKEFYDHYTRTTHKVKETVQTPYTIALEKRSDLESVNPYLKGFRGVTTNATRPAAKLSSDKETEIRKSLVRQKIGVTVGDYADLLADVSNALNALIKQVNGQNVSSEDTAAIQKYQTRQAEVSAILASDYTK
jgi:hypothetical protein